VFEAFTDTDFDRSVAAGGRYDSMIAHLSDHDDDLTGVGASFGVDTIVDCLATEASTYEDTLFVIPMMDVSDVLPRVESIRDQGVDVMIGDPDKQFGKNMDYADKEGFGYLLVIGDDEKETESYTVKNMETGDETTVSLDSVGQSISNL
jgi:histidyl-tRNA synthetase